MLEDVIAAMENATLLRPAAPIARDGLVVIDDFEEAKRRAYGDGAWKDLRAAEVARILAVTHSAPNGGALRDAVRDLGAPLTELTVSRLPPTYAEIVNDVAADLQNIVLDRMVPDAGSGLFPRLWLVYVQGGWPCGMEGDRLVAYAPPINRDGIAVQ